MENRQGTVMIIFDMNLPVGLVNYHNQLLAYICTGIFYLKIVYSKNFLNQLNSKVCQVNFIDNSILIDLVIDLSGYIIIFIKIYYFRFKIYKLIFLNNINYICINFKYQKNIIY